MLVREKPTSPNGLSHVNTEVYLRAAGTQPSALEHLNIFLLYFKIVFTLDKCQIDYQIHSIRSFGEAGAAKIGEHGARVVDDKIVYVQDLINEYGEVHIKH